MIWKYYTDSQWFNFTDVDWSYTQGSTFSYAGSGGVYLAGSSFDFDSSDVILLLSGGVGNTNSSLSLGGPASTAQVTQFLFDNVNLSESKMGKTDYRCVYLYNSNPVFSLTDTQIFVKDKPYGGASIQIGVVSQSEVQNVIITGNPTGGSFTLSYLNTDFIVNYNSSASVWAGNFQTAIRGISGLEDTVVSYGIGSNTVVFTVNFLGKQADRYQEILDLVSNSLVGSPEILISKIFSGSPVNSVAQSISSGSIPSNVSFQTAYSSPLFIGEIAPFDLVPIWIQRTVPANSPPAIDGFLFAIVADPMD